MGRDPKWIIGQGLALAPIGKIVIAAAHWDIKTTNILSTKVTQQVHAVAETSSQVGSTAKHRQPIAKHYCKFFLIFLLNNLRTF